MATSNRSRRKPKRRGTHKHDPANPSHYCYTTGCRKPACIEARNEYLREWRKQKTAATA